MIPYMGGKSNLAKWIIEKFPKNYENMLYCEVFGGGGWVMFRKTPSVNEVYNDLYKDLVNLFTVVRDRYKSIQHKAKWTFHSRAMFDLAKTDLSTGKLRDVDRALNYLIVKVQSFSADEKNYGYSRCLKKRSEWAFMLARLEKIRDRMRDVNIECLDFQKVIEKYDTKDTIFYVDPPYVDKEFYYKIKFDKNDHKRLADTLKHIDGKFALSYYPHELVKSAYSTFNVVRRKTTKHSCAITRAYKGDRPQATELLITNY